MSEVCTRTFALLMMLCHRYHILEGSPINFVDDIYSSLFSPSNHTVLQLDITVISLWVPANSRSLDESYFMLISWKCYYFPTLYVDSDNVLLQVNSVKYLGIDVTADLSWSTHINNISLKARKFIGVMYH